MSEEKDVPEGAIGVRMVGPEDFGIGVSPELPGVLLLVLKKDGVALGFDLDSAAELLHDRVCMVLSMQLEAEETSPEEQKLLAN